MNDSVVQNLQIVRLSDADAKYQTDHLSIFRQLVLGNEYMYPNIDRWFNEKVVPGLRSNERIAYVGYLDSKPVISAVVKRGDVAKFCHLRISQELQETNLGELFFSLMALEARAYAKDIYFTLPESLWLTKMKFFQSFGFLKATKADDQYRFFEEELQTSASFSHVWQAVLRKLPKLLNTFCVGGHRMSGDLLLSIKPEFAARIMTGEKAVEIRRRFSKRWIGSRANIYATAPVKGLIGEAQISNVRSGKPKNIWKHYSAYLGCCQKSFDDYTSDCEVVYAIELDQVKTYRAPIMLSYASNLIGEELVPPQSYCELGAGKPWTQAVSIAALLHGFRAASSNHIAKLGPTSRTPPCVSEDRQGMLL